MPDKTMRIDLDLYDQVAKVAERADRTPREPVSQVGRNQKEISHAGEI